MPGGKSKNRYQSFLITYTQRREALRAKCPPEEYSKRAATINKKLKHIRQALSRIEKHERRLREINEMLKEFMGVSVKHKSKSRLPEIILAKGIFCRHCLEMGIPRKYIQLFCGYEDNFSVVYIRRQFIRSFRTHKENREMWYRWKAFVDDSVPPPCGVDDI